MVGRSLLSQLALLLALSSCGEETRSSIGAVRTDNTDEVITQARATVADLIERLGLRPDLAIAQSLLRQPRFSGPVAEWGCVPAFDQAGRLVSAKTLKVVDFRTGRKHSTREYSQRELRESHDQILRYQRSLRMDPTASFPIFSDSLLLAVASALASDSKQANYAIGRGSGEESDQLQVASLVGDSRVVVAADALYATAKPRSRDVGFRVSGSWQFSASRGVIIEAVTMALTPDGDIAVPVPGDGAVRVYHPDGTLRAELTGMMAPAGVAVTNQGDLFVTESRVGSFRRYDATANGFELSDRSLGQGQLEFPTGIAIDERTGHIFIGDKSLKRVVEFDSEGVFIRELVEMANPPSVIAWSPKIGLIASDGAGLVRLQPGGGVYEKVQVTGGTVAGLGVNVDGGVLVSVLEGRVYLLDESGRLSGPLATDSDIGVPFSLASRVRDVIFVYDMLGFRILRLERSANDHR